MKAQICVCVNPEYLGTQMLRDCFSRYTMFNSGTIFNNNTDAFVFFLPNNGWSYKVDELNKSMIEKYNYAIANKKKIYIAYKPQSEQYARIYEARTNNFNGTIIEAITGTYDSIMNLKCTESTCKDVSDHISNDCNTSSCKYSGPQEQPILYNQSSFDRRLLLC